MAIFNSYVSLPEGTQNGYRIPTLTKNHWSSESSSWGFHLDSGWGQDLQSFKHMCLFFFLISRCMNIIYIHTYIYISYTIYYIFFWYIQCQLIVHWFSTWDDPRKSTWGIFGEGFHICLDPLLIKSFHGWLIDVGGNQNQQRRVTGINNQ